MARITKTITFSLPPDMADRVEEIMRQEGAPGASSSVRRCAATSRNASGDSCSGTANRGPASSA